MEKGHKYPLSLFLFYYLFGREAVASEILEFDKLFVNQLSKARDGDRKAIEYLMKDTTFLKKIASSKEKFATFS